MTFLIIEINRNKVCPDCFNDTFYHDLIHHETYCRECGLIVRDDAVMTQAQYDFLNERMQLAQDLLPTAIIK